MLASLLIVFREVLEAGLIVGIVLAATVGVPFRGRWIAGGIAAGVLGASLVAAFATVIANAVEGMGQEIFTAIILLIAVAMLGWHSIWMASHGRELGRKAKALGCRRLGRREVAPGARRRRLRGGAARRLGGRAVPLRRCRVDPRAAACHADRRVGRYPRGWPGQLLAVSWPACDTGAPSLYGDPLDDSIVGGRHGGPGGRAAGRRRSAADTRQYALGHVTRAAGGWADWPTAPHIGGLRRPPVGDSAGGVGWPLSLCSMRRSVRSVSGNRQ